MAFKVHPGCPSACRLLFPQWASQKRWEDIRTTATQANKDLPAEPSTIAWLGLALVNLGEHDRASELIAAADASEAADPDLHVMLLEAAMQSNGLVAARELLWLRRASATNSTAGRYMSEIDASMFIKPSPYWKSLTRPGTYTKQEIQSELDKWLGPEERRFVASPIEVTDEISTTAAGLTSGLTNALLKAALLSAYVIEQRVKPNAPGENCLTNSRPELACHYYASQLAALARAIGISAWLVHVELNTKEASGYHDRTALLVGEELMLSDPMWGQTWASGEDAVGCRVLDDIQAIADHLAQTNSPPLLRVALKLDRDDLWTWIVCVTKLAQQHQVKEAEELLLRLLTSSPTLLRR